MMDAKERPNRKKGLLSAMALVLVLGQTGCGQTADMEEPMIILENTAEEKVYNLAVVSYGDVVDTDSVQCAYMQTKDQEISFSVSGKQVEEVCVKSGDTVEKGQLLAVLSHEGLQEEIRRLEYQIERNGLLYEQSLAQEADALEERQLIYEYRSGQSPSEETAYLRDVEEIQQRYRYIQEDYQDSIHGDSVQLEALRKEMEESSVYAGMAGTVSYVKPDLAGSLSVCGEPVIKIIDGSECVFQVAETEYAGFFEEDTQVDFLIVTNTGAVECKLVPFQMEAWGDVLYFKLPEDSEVELDVSPGSMGTMKIEVARRENVLNIPASAVHTADGKHYVYMLGEDDMREIRWIETGLYGDGAVEILSGLSEGERVIVK